MTEKNKHLDRITQDVFALWEAAWRAGYESCKEDIDVTTKYKENETTI